jgi:hypothetical protein
MSLDRWGEIIRRQGEEARTRQDDKLKAIRKGLPAKTRELITMSDKDLLDHYQEYLRRTCNYDVREAKLWIRIAQSARKEILKRMA